MVRKWYMVLAAALLIIATLCGCGKEESPALTVGGHEISQEEFSVYCEIVKKDMVDRQDTEQVRKEAARYAAEVYSLFDIAEECGAEDRFSYTEFKQRLSETNEGNRDKIANGDVVMGLVEYTETDYFEYILSEYRQKTEEKLADTADEAVLAGAEIYYEENRSDYIDNIKYEYEITTEENGERKTEIKTTDYQSLTQSYHSTDILGDILMTGNIGEKYDTGNAEVVLLSREETFLTFEQAERQVVSDYIINEYLPELIEERAEHMEIREAARLTGRSSGLPPLF